MDAKKVLRALAILRASLTEAVESEEVLKTPEAKQFVRQVAWNVVCIENFIKDDADPTPEPSVN